MPFRVCPCKTLGLLYDAQYVLLHFEQYNDT